MASDITLHFLQASRSIRIAWLLAELNLPYTLKFSPREKDKAPVSFKEASGNPLGKAPTLQDGGLTIYESGAIAEYVCDKYDAAGRLTCAKDEARKIQVLQWVHEAEGTFLVHALAITYARWFCPPSALPETERGMAGNVLADLDFLNAELGKSKSGWLVGEAVTLADIMMQFSIHFILARRLGTKDVRNPTTRWANVKNWLVKCEGSQGYREATKKSGYTLFPDVGVTWKAEDKEAFERFMDVQ